MSLLGSCMQVPAVYSHRWSHCRETSTMGETRVFAEPSEDGWIDLGTGVRRRVRLSLPDLMLVEFRFEAGAVGALHAHPHRQCSYVASGSFEVTIDGATQRLAKGGAYIVPSE